MGDIGFTFPLIKESCECVATKGQNHHRLCLQALRSVPRERAEWVVWIDMDVILGDIGFTFPLIKDSYQGKDLIVWGNYEAVLAGDTYNGTLPCPGLSLCEHVHVLMVTAQLSALAWLGLNSGLISCKCAHVPVARQLFAEP